MNSISTEFIVPNEKLFDDETFNILIKIKNNVTLNVEIEKDKDNDKDKEGSIEIEHIFDDIR